MRSYGEAAMAAIEDGSAIVAGAAEILVPGDPVRVWGGPWEQELDGEMYLGVANRGLVNATGAGLGNAAQNITLELSGVDPDLLPLLDEADVRGASVILRRTIWDGSGTQLLDVHVVRRGRVDQLVSEETVGGQAVVRALVEGAARGLGRRGARMRSDADQRLIDPSDGGMRHVSFAGEKTLYWGGKPPENAGSAVGSKVTPADIRRQAYKVLVQ